MQTLSVPLSPNKHYFVYITSRHQLLFKSILDSGSAQEMASRGISLVYSRGDESTQKQLVEALVGVLQGTGGAKAKPVKLSDDTQVRMCPHVRTGPCDNPSICT